MKGFVALAVSSIIGFVIVGALLFGPAGTFDYWQAWAFLAELAGYRDYTEKVRSRLVPYVW